MATLGRSKQTVQKVAFALGALLLSGLVLDAISPTGVGDAGPLRSGVVALASPIMRLGAGLHERMSELWAGVFGAEALERENEALRQELIELRVRRSTDRARETLASLSQQMSTNIPEGTYDLIAASVLSGPAAHGRKVLWIDKGTRDGLRGGMVVLGPHGIIGEVEQVFEVTALVELVTDVKAAWGAEVEGQGELGLVRGTADPLRIEFSFSRTTVSAEPGALVVSSGMAGSVAPGGVPFGKIESISRNKSGEPVAVVKLEEAPESLRTVFILPLARIPREPGNQ